MAPASCLADRPKVHKLHIPERCRDIEVLRNLPNLQVLSRARRDRIVVEQFWRESTAAKAERKGGHPGFPVRSISRRDAASQPRTWAECSERTPVSGPMLVLSRDP